MVEQKWAEKVLARAANGCVVKSELVPLEKAGDDCKNPCGHIGVKYEDCWPCTLVSCLVCGEGLGVA